MSFLFSNNNNNNNNNNNEKLLHFFVSCRLVRFYGRVFFQFSAFVLRYSHRDFKTGWLIRLWLWSLAILVNFVLKFVIGGRMIRASEIQSFPFRCVSFARVYFEFLFLENPRKWEGGGGGGGGEGGESMSYQRVFMLWQTLKRKENKMRGGGGKRLSVN